MQCKRHDVSNLEPLLSQMIERQTVEMPTILHTSISRGNWGLFLSITASIAYSTGVCIRVHTNGLYFIQTVVVTKYAALNALL